MANLHRGEISASLNGKSYTLVLTLGALAELEYAFAAEDLSALAHRFEEGKLKASDLIKIITIGLNAAGNNFSEQDVAAMKTEGAIAGFIKIVADLLAATFTNQQDTKSGKESGSIKENITAPL